MSTVATSTATAKSAAELLRGWDRVEFWVGNARTTAQFFCSAFGFRVTAYAGPETGVADRASYVLEQNGIRFVVTAGLTADSPIAAHVRMHGDGVRDLALVGRRCGRGIRVGRGAGRPRR